MAALGECVPVPRHGRGEGGVEGGADAGGKGERDEQAVSDRGDFVRDGLDR